MMITRRDWWLGMALLAAVVIFAVVFPRVFPRYECHLQTYQGRVQPILTDRWSGSIELGCR